MESIVVPAEASKIPVVVDFANKFLKKHSITDFNKVDIVIDEVLCNIASYAYGGAKKGVCVNCWYDDKTSNFYLQFVDEGIQYNPLEKSDPDITLSAEDRNIGGLGIFIVKKMMDNVSYEYQNGRNVLTLSKVLKSKKEELKVNIKKTQQGDVTILNLEGRLDTNTSGDLEKELEGIFAQHKNNMVLDLKELSYVSSAGLRVLLGAQKQVNSTEGEMLIKNANPEIMEIFEVTGFVDVLSIER